VVVPELLVIPELVIPELEVIPELVLVHVVVVVVAAVVVLVPAPVPVEPPPPPTMTDVHAEPATASAAAPTVQICRFERFIRASLVAWKESTTSAYHVVGPGARGRMGDPLRLTASSGGRRASSNGRASLERQTG
jgi:hypothetical protein